MSDPNQDFAEAAVAAMQEQQQAAGAPSAEGGTEPTETTDPVLELAKTLQTFGVAPDKARETLERIAYMQTPQGQEEMYRNFMGTEAGQRLKQGYGQEVLADMLARNPEAVYKMAQELGYKPPAPASTMDDDELSPVEREAKALKAQMAALENRMQQIQQGAGSEIQELKQKLQGREVNETRRDAFVEWSKAATPTPLPAKAYATIAKRAHELASLYPQQYAGAAGFKRAATDAYSELSSVAPLFQQKPRPRNGSGGGGGVAGVSADDSKLTLAEKIERWSQECATGAQES